MRSSFSCSVYKNNCFTFDAGQNSPLLYLGFNVENGLATSVVALRQKKVSCSENSLNLCFNFAKLFTLLNINVCFCEKLSLLSFYQKEDRMFIK